MILRSASLACAMASSAQSVMKQFNSGCSRSARASTARVTSTGEISLRPMRRRRSAAERKHGSSLIQASLPEIRPKRPASLPDLLPGHRLRHASLQQSYFVPPHQLTPNQLARLLRAEPGNPRKPPKRAWSPVALTARMTLLLTCRPIRISLQPIRFRYAHGSPPAALFRCRGGRTQRRPGRGTAANGPTAAVRSDSKARGRNRRIPVSAGRPWDGIDRGGSRAVVAGKRGARPRRGGHRGCACGGNGAPGKVVHRVHVHTGTHHVAKTCSGVTAPLAGSRA